MVKLVIYPQTCNIYYIYFFLYKHILDITVIICLSAAKNLHSSFKSLEKQVLKNTLSKSLVNMIYGDQSIFPTGHSIS